MIQIVDVKKSYTLDDYAAHAPLQHEVQKLREAASEHMPRLRGKEVCMLNSTAQGGGVAEMLPKVVSILRELGLPTQWVVMDGDNASFFDLTKHLHNLLHDSGTPQLGPDERELYEAVSRQVAEALRQRMAKNEVLVVHDPQPLAVGALLKEHLGLTIVWRCHIGLDHQTPATQAAWNFLRPWAEKYDHVVFSIDDYVPSFLDDRASIIPPAIDPLSHKNRELSSHKLSGILLNASLGTSKHPVLTPPFETPALRLQSDGVFAPAIEPNGFGLLYRPMVTQVSRWDRLKGFVPLLSGFAHLKAQRHHRHDGLSDRHRRRLDLVRLVLAGPDPDSIQDDPEGLDVFNEVCARWRELSPEIQQDIAVLVLPMGSRKVNALMVNALQRCSTVVVQNSLREGFGLTATEAMWKRCPVMGTQAVGLREQIRDGIHGRLVSEAENPEEVAATLDEMLEDAKQREVWGRNAQLRVSNQYLVFAQVRRWLDVLDACC